MPTIKIGIQKEQIETHFDFRTKRLNMFSIKPQNSL